MASRNWSWLVCGLTVVLIGGSIHAQEGAFDTLPGNPAVQGTQEDDKPLVPADPGALVPQGPQQTVEVNEDRAGWQAAGNGVAKGRLSEGLRANWVMVDSNGLLRGTVIGFESKPVTDVSVYLIKNGQVVNTTKVNEQGQFSFNNVQQGAYGLIGFGADNFFAFGFDAIRNSDNPKANAPESITVMASPNATSINTDWIDFFAPKVKFRVYGRFNSRQGTEDSAALYGTDGISVHYPAAIPASSIQSHAVTALADGRMVGRVHQIDSLNGRPVDVRNTRIMLLKDDDVYAATSTDNFGVFEFTLIEPGFYSLVAAGEDGMASIGLEIVKSDADNEAADSNVVPIDVSLLPSESSGWLLSHANEVAYQRALKRSATLNAARSGCNCPPNAGYNDAIMRALQPSQRGRFWKRLNQYFDEIFYGQDAGQGQATPQNYYGGNGYPPQPGYGQPGNYQVAPGAYVPPVAPLPAGTN